MPATCSEIGGAVDLIAALRRVTQRVAQQKAFDACVSNVEAHIAKLVEENNKLVEEKNKLAALAFSSDVVLESKDGIKVPAMKQTLVDASDVFAGMFSKHTSEGREGLVRTTASVETLRYVSRCVHSPGGGMSADSGTILEVCELAERWQLPEVLKAAAAALGDGLDSSIALKMLVSADRHIEVGSHSAAWKDILEDAAKAVASAMPAIAKDAEFKMLSIEAIAHVMTHLQEETFELPELEGGLELEEQGDWSKPVSWVEGVFESSPARQKFRLESNIKDGKASFRLRRSNPSLPIFIRGHLELRNSHGSCFWNRFIIEQTLTSQSKLRIAQGVTQEDAAREFPDSRYWLSGRVVVTKEQRQSDVLNLWLLASGYIKRPLEPPAQLPLLRRCACSFNIDDADAPTLKMKLEQYGLPTKGGLQTLQMRLRDAMFAELKLSPVLQQASSALATLSASNFERAAANCSLFHLDAAAMSQILAHQDLRVESETRVLDHALRWASYVGRTTEVIDKVMPLVRFPLVSMIKPPAKLKELKLRSKVIAELVTEAVKCQVEPTSRSGGTGEPLWSHISPTKKHALLSSMPPNTEQPRTKRRRFCTKDKVPKVDAATAVLESVFSP